MIEEQNAIAGGMMKAPDVVLSRRRDEAVPAGTPAPDKAGSLPVRLHQMGAVLLVIYAISHFSDLLLGNPAHHLRNPVLVFLTNQVGFFLAGCLELAVAFCCWRFPGKNTPNVAILTFVSLLLWYRYSFYYVGGHSCGCAGIIGKVFRLTKQTETRISVASLVCLVAATGPWLLAHGRRLLGLRSPAALLLGFALFLPASALAKTVVEVRGEYSARMYNPRTGAVYKAPLDGGFTSDAEFLAVISQEQTRIVVTNTTDCKWWAEYLFDGTNSFLLNSYDFHTVHTNALKADFGAHASVSHFPYYIAESEDRIGIAVAWMTYGFRPASFPANPAGVVQFPLPWLACRTDLFAYGYRWNIAPSPDQMFVDHCEAVRDQSLDLDDEGELLRPELIVPVDNNFRNWQLQKLQLRRQWPTDFVIGSYKCDEWVKTNGWAVPAASELRCFMRGYTNHSFRAVLKAREVRVSNTDDADAVLSKQVKQPTLVHDFRYRRVKMPRIFEAAEYTAKAGELLKGPDDPSLAGQADQYLKHGPAYGAWRLSSRNVIALSVLGIFLLPLAIMLLRAKKQK